MSSSRRPRLRLLEAAVKSAAPEARAAILVVAGLDLPLAVAEAIVRRVVRAYAAVEEIHVLDDPRLARSTVTMAKMAVGDIEVIDVAHQSILHMNMITARARTGVPDARWRVTLLSPGRFSVERLPNGTPPERDPMKNSRAVELAMIPLGAAKTCCHIKSTNQVNSSTKVQARRILRSTDADWRLRKLKSGAVQATRWK